MVNTFLASYFVPARLGIQHNLSYKVYAPRFEQNGSMAEQMNEADRELFWAACSDAAKDSNLYRKYARALLQEAQINMEEVPLAVINRAWEINELALFFKDRDQENWFLDSETASFLCDENSLNYLDIFLEKKQAVGELLGALKQLNYENPLKSLSAINQEQLTLLRDNYISAIRIMNALHHQENSDPLYYLTRLESQAMEHVLAEERESLDKIAPGEDLAHGFYLAM